MIVLHHTGDVDLRYMPYWVGGVPSAAINLAAYLNRDGEDEHRIFIQDHRLEKPFAREGNTYRVWTRKSILKMLFAHRKEILSGVDVFVSHHPIHPLLYLLLKILKPGLVVGQYAYTKPVRMRPWFSWPYFTAAIDRDVANHFSAAGFKDVDVLGIIPDVGRYDKPIGPIPDRPRVYHSAGGRAEMGFFYYIRECFQVRDDIRCAVNFDRRFIDPDDFERGDALVSELGFDEIERVEAREDIDRFLDVVDILIYPILDHVGKKNTSLMMLEAMLMGKVVICTATGGYGKIIRDGENGFILNPEPGRLADLLRKLLKSDLSEIRRNARRTALERFEKNLGLQKKFYEGIRGRCEKKQVGL